jgi:hypothetical protein
MSLHMKTPTEDARQTEDRLNAAADRTPFGSIVSLTGCS